MTPDNNPGGMMPDRAKVEAAIKATEYKYFGDYEMSDDQRDAVDTLVEAARAALAYTPKASPPADMVIRDDLAEIIEAELLAWRGGNGGVYAIKAAATGISIKIRASMIAAAPQSPPAPARVDQGASEALGEVVWTTKQSVIDAGGLAGKLSHINAALTAGPWDVWRERTDARDDAVRELIEQVHSSEPFAGAVFLLNAGGKCPATTGCGPTSEANANGIAELRNMLPDLIAAAEALTQAQARVVQLEAALKPFADVADAVTSMPEGAFLWSRTDGPKITREHVLDARTTLSRTGEG